MVLTPLSNQGIDKLEKPALNPTPRRELLKKAAYGTAAATCILTPPQIIAKPKTFRMRLVLSIPKTLPIWADHVIAWAKKLETLSSGRLNIRVYGGGELVPSLGVFDAVSQGQVDMAHTASYYWKGKIPCSVFFCTIPFGMTTRGMRSWLHYGGGKQLWSEIYKPHNLISFPAGCTGMQMGGWFNKKIESEEDLKGLKIRMPGLGGQVLEKLGAKPVLVAGGEIFTNLSTGVIDATEWVGPYHDSVIGLHKAAKYYYYPGWHEPGAILELMINRKKWDSLPEDLQLLIQSTASEMDLMMNSEFLHEDAIALQKLKDEHNITPRPFPKPLMKKLHAISWDLRSEIAKSSKIAGKIVDSYNSFQKIHDQQQEVTEWAYRDWQS